MIPLLVFFALCIGSLSHAAVVVNDVTGEFYLPIVAVGNEYYEVYLQQQNELTFAVTTINSGSAEAVRVVRRGRGSSENIYNPAEGILSLASVQLGTDFYQVTMTNQGNMVFMVTSATRLGNDDSGTEHERGSGVADPPDSSASGEITARLSVIRGALSEVNMPYVKVGGEYYEVDLQQVDDLTFAVTTISAPLRLRSAPSAFNSYDPVTDLVYMPIVQVGADLYEVNMAHLGDLVFRITSATPVSGDTSDDDSDTSDRTRGGRS